VPPDGTEPIPILVPLEGTAISGRFPVLARSGSVGGCRRFPLTEVLLTRYIRCELFSGPDDEQIQNRPIGSVALSPMLLAAHAIIGHGAATKQAAPSAPIMLQLVRGPLDGTSPEPQYCGHRSERARLYGPRPTLSLKCFQNCSSTDPMAHRSRSDRIWEATNGRLDPRHRRSRGSDRTFPWPINQSMAHAIRLMGALIFGLAASTAFCADGKWGPWPSASPFVAAGFQHDDGGALVLMCDTKTKQLSLGLEESRANWQAGGQMKFMTRSDDGTELNDSMGFVMGPTRLIVKEDATLHLHAMGKATAFFVVGTGEYARIFPAADFRNAMEPVLRACGDHW
jgi:hypothetical protein